MGLFYFSRHHANLNIKTAILKKLLHKSSFIRWAINKMKSLTGSGKFESSEQYWIDRYKKGGNSGIGSYDHLAEFKAEVLNPFVKEAGIKTVIEFGCGDGNQLGYFNFPQYLGVDVSPTAVELCLAKYPDDPSKSFILTSEYQGQSADLSLSLDVLFHLVEDKIFNDYMQGLFKAAKEYVVIYSSNYDDHKTAPHVRHRKFTDWVEKQQPGFQLIEHVPNKFPGTSTEGMAQSPADFFIYKKSS